MGRPTLFSDVDGTLCFHEEAHGVRVVGQAPDGAVLVSEGGRVYRAFDVSTSSYRVFLAEETLQLARALAQRCAIVLVTGGRPSTVAARRDLLGFAEGVILENGGVIFDRHFHIDPRWWSELDEQRRALPEVAETLRKLGWRLDAEGRTSALRVRLRDNPGRTREEFQRLCGELTLPTALKKTLNLENLDIILAGAGKEAAVRFWMRAHDLDRGATIGIGDDVNDVEFLRTTGEAFVLASAYPEALTAARQEGWHVSKAGGIEGINEVLRGLLDRPVS